MEKSETTFLALIISLPSAKPADRMRVWRGLKAMGCAVLRDGVYLLPDRPGKDQLLLPSADEVIRAGGSAQLVSLQCRDDQQAANFTALFDRSDDYQALHERIASARVTMANADASVLRKEVRALKRELDGLGEVDFFPGEAQRQVTAAFRELQDAAQALLSPGEPQSASGQLKRLDPKQYRGKTWATRQHLWVDRVASAWLIRRFIDPDARFVWLDAPADCPPSALGFDFDGATFTHLDGRVSFETLAASFGLDADPAIVRLGQVVHFLDVGGVPVADAPGLERMVEGARRQCTDDDALLALVSAALNLIYAAYSGSASDPSVQKFPADATFDDPLDLLRQPKAQQRVRRARKPKADG